MPPPTIQIEPLQSPSVEVRELDLSPEQTKNRESKRAAAKIANVTAAVQRETESPMTLSGLTDKQRRREKRWLEQEGLRLRSKQEQQSNPRD